MLSGPLDNPIYRRKLNIGRENKKVLSVLASIAHQSHVENVDRKQLLEDKPVSNEWEAFKTTKVVSDKYGPAKKNGMTQV